MSGLRPLPGGGAFSALLAVCAIAAPAYAQAPPDVHASAPVTVAVTVYRDDLALITETRRVVLPGGPARVVFDGVLDRAVPQSAIVRGLEGAERERNFDFDGLNPMSLLWRSIGAAVGVVRTNPGTGVETMENATVAAAGDGVMLKFADRTEALGCSGLPEKLVFARIPDGLAAKPALSTVLADAPPGVREVTLSYLATGIEWATDYVVTLNEDATRARVDAWITLTNDGEEGFVDARVGAVAGELSRTWNDGTRATFTRVAQRACWPMAATTDFPEPPPPPPPPPAPMAAMADSDEIIVTGGKLEESMQAVAIAVTQEELGDYQLYALNEATSVAARQTKQVMFLQRHDVAMQRILHYRVNSAHAESGNAWDAEPTMVYLRMKNESANGLGDPLPEGAARVFAPFADFGMLYAGESRTRDTPVGVEWELETGENSDVTVRPTLVARTERPLSGDRARVTADFALEIANATDVAQIVEIAQDALGASQRISKASAPHAVKHGKQTWTLTVPAQTRQTLIYRLRWIED